MNLAHRTRNFWNAAFYIRRAHPDRDLTVARLTLKQVVTLTTGTVHDRAEQLLKEIEDGPATGRHQER